MGRSRAAAARRLWHGARGRRPGGALAGLCALALLAPPAQAQSSGYARVAEVAVHGSVPWPDHVGKGYLPLVLELTNESEEQRNVVLHTFHAEWGSSVSIDAAVQLAPGERARVELAAPAWTQTPYGQLVRYNVSVRCGNEQFLIQHLGASQQRIAGVRTGIAVTRERAEAALVQTWQEQLSSAEVTGPRQWVGGSWTTTTRGNLELASVPFDELPRRIEGYTSLDLALIDARGGLRDPARLEPLFAWVRTGGDALLDGVRDPSVLFAALPAAEGWIEERFSLAELGGARVWRCGLGRIATVPPAHEEARAFESPESKRAVAWLLERRPVGSYSSATQYGHVPAIPSLGQLPYRAFALLLVLFAITIGPVNFYLVHRARRPALLLVTIPALALASATLFLAYGLLHQGIDVKGATHSVALLDQRVHRAVNTEARELFVGLTPGGGLVPGAGTVVLPIEEGRPTKSQHRYRIDERSGTRLTGRYLPARLPVRQVLLTERASRARLEAVLTPEGPRVTNGLGVHVRELRLVDPAGKVHWLTRELPPGGAARLEPSAQSEGEMGRRAWVRDTHERVLGSAPGTWAARLAENPLRDACGLRATETRGEHLLLGVLSARAEDWR